MAFVGHRTFRARSACASLLAVAAALVASLAAGPAGAASSNSTVAVTVPSATSLSAAACATGTPATTIPTILASGAGRTPATCQVAFGSSNDTASLRVHQSDLRDQALWMPSWGVPDTTWGGGGTGRRLTTFASGGSYSRTVSTTTDGRVVIGGYAVVGGNEASSLVRYTTAGIEDPTFGPSANGRVSHQLSATNDQVSFVIVLPDDRIVVAGYEEAGATGDAAYVMRLEADGDLDPTFGTGGVTWINRAGHDRFNSMAIQPDGRIVAGGYQTSGPKTAFVARFTQNGQFDTSFGTGGVQTVAAGTTTEAKGLVVLSDGSIVVTGETESGSGTDVLVAKLTPAGALDLGFGASGIRVVAINPVLNEQVADVAVQSTGHIVVAAAADLGGGSLRDQVAVRLTPGGALDVGWGAGGVRAAPFAAGAVIETSSGLVIQPDDAIVLAGYRSGPNQFGMARLTAAGAVDTSFGTGGVAISHTGTAQAVGRDSDGRLLLVGGLGSDMAVARYSALSVADYSNTGGAGDTDWTGGANTFGACLESLAGGGATAAWTTTGSCTTVDTDPWNAIKATAGTAGATVARAMTSGSTVTASLRFGMRAASSQRAGGYFAPVTFDVVAPAV